MKPGFNPTPKRKKNCHEAPMFLLMLTLPLSSVLSRDPQHVHDVQNRFQHLAFIFIWIYLDLTLQATLSFNKNVSSRSHPLFILIFAGPCRIRCYYHSHSLHCSIVPLFPRLGSGSEACLKLLSSFNHVF